MVDRGGEVEIKIELLLFTYQYNASETAENASISIGEYWRRGTDPTPRILHMYLFSIFC